MSNVSLKYNINGVRVPQLQLAYIHGINNNPQKYLVMFCLEVHYIWWGNKYLEPQECKDQINPHKTIILAIIMLVSNNNPHGKK